MPLRSGALDPDELARTAHETRADVIYVADPDNPTGRSQGAQAVLNLADALALATLLIVDGAYAEYQDPCHRLTAKEVGGRRMLWLRSFSKAYALAGLRIGYAVGDPDLLAALDDGAEHYVVGRVAESAALAALDATAHLDRVLAQTAEGRAHYTAELGALGLTVLPGRTNFVTARTAAPQDGGTPRRRTRASGDLHPPADRPRHDRLRTDQHRTGLATRDGTGGRRPPPRPSPCRPHHLREPSWPVPPTT